MAKRYDNNFDAEGFVENFRAQDDSASSPPAQAETDATTASVISKQEKRNPSRPSKEKPSDMADEYKAKFIDDLKYRYPPIEWPQVKISLEFKSEIVRLENLCNAHRANLSTFINYVLEQHFRDYDAHIKELENKFRK